jgi:hypothetical protein
MNISPTLKKIVAGGLLCGGLGLAGLGTGAGRAGQWRPVYLVSRTIHGRPERSE